MDFAQQSDVALGGLDYLDKRENALKWINRHGNPYRTIAFDPDGKWGNALGLSALPVTLVIDADGIVRLQLSGSLTTEQIKTQLLPQVKELKNRLVKLGK